MNETTTGAPLTATLGERVGGDPHVSEVREKLEQGQQATRGQQAGQAGAAREGGRRPRAAARSMPWGILALAVVGWLLARGLARGVGKRARRLGAAAGRLAARVA